MDTSASSPTTAAVMTEPPAPMPAARESRCPDCGRKFLPCPARWDGEPTTVGFYPCVCSYESWLANREDGEGLGGYRRRMNTEFPVAA